MIFLELMLPPIVVAAVALSVLRYMRRPKYPTINVKRWVIEEDSTGNVVIHAEGTEVPVGFANLVFGSELWRFVASPTGRRQEFIVTHLESGPEGTRWEAMDMETFMRLRRVKAT